MTTDYRVQMDFGRAGDYSHALADVSNRVLRLMANYGLDTLDADVAAPANMTIILDNNDGALWQDDSGAAYYGLLLPGLLVRWQVSTNGGSTWATLWQGKTRALPGLQPGRGASMPNLTATVTCSGPFTELMMREYAPPMTANQRLDLTIADALGRTMIWPYAQDVWVLGASTLEENTTLPDISGYIDLETSRETPAYTGDTGGGVTGQTAMGYLYELVAAEMGGRLFYDAATGKVTFHNRQHDTDATTIAATISDPVVERTAQAVYGDLLCNRHTVNYVRRFPGTPNTVVYTADVPFTLAGKETRRMTVRYNVTDYPDAQVACVDGVRPVADADYTANLNSDGTSMDLTPWLSVLATFNASSADLVLHNDALGTTNVTKLQLRGTPLITLPQEQVTKSCAASISTYGLATGQPETITTDDPEKAQSYAGLYVAGRKTPYTRIPSVTFLAEHSSAYTGYMTSVGVGERVRVDLSAQTSAHDAEYIVIGIAHDYDAATRQHYITWQLKPAVSSRAWRLESSVDGQLGETTVLAF